MDLETELDGTDWIHLDHDTVQGQVIVNIIMKIHNIEGILEQLCDYFSIPK
jgi:hypothetical protein